VAQFRNVDDEVKLMSLQMLGKKGCRGAGIAATLEQRNHYGCASRAFSRTRADGAHRTLAAEATDPEHPAHQYFLDRYRIACRH
jgi:hypothetical protein